ncbi:uncharacterized protein LOC133723086 [Rosa rugosa]|uniref:uncharacterized protein LOC133723086 n=1 Tax=Rosa rugosa TaxID=74645 RepID=UPI002B416FE8|nr:uncharacterized protein LOC133723086 [Rosa rugosa]
MEVDYQMCYRAKLKAKKMAQGSHEDQYHLLESYAHELKKRNPGTSVWIQTELDGEVTRFKRIYICIEALKKGWREGCRPYIGLDGCHLKSVHKGQLLSAIGIDGNNGIYPIAWAVVEAESRETWTWFLEFLKVDLEIHHSAHYTFMSDKQKGLEQAIKELFPDAAHMHCVRHFHNNFKTDGFHGLELKQKLWAIARSCTINTFQEAMEDMKKSTVQGWQWCLDRPAVHWSKSYFDPKFKCDILLNNHSESFNKSILQARKKSILACLEDIRIGTMVRMANRRQSGHKWRCQVGPRVEKILKKNAELAQEYRALQSSPLRFEIQGKGIACTSGVVSAHSVALDLKQCSCKRWDISGLPCAHAGAAILSLGRSPDEFVDDYFTKDTYLKAYSPIMFPIAGVTEWDKLHRPIAHPLYKRQPGRPKQSRNKEAGEVAPPPGTQKLPKVYYSQVTCGICKKKGHNRRTCKQMNQAGNVEEAAIVQEEAENVQEEAANVQEEAANVQEEAANVQQLTEVEQESQPACEATQQSQTCTAPTTSSIPQFIQRRGMAINPLQVLIFGRVLNIRISTSPWSLVSAVTTTEPARYQSEIEANGDGHVFGFFMLIQAMSTDETTSDGAIQFLHE